jgi:chemotaxis signal transduction protein
VKQRCGFYIGDLFFSVPIESVREVLKKASVAPVPGTPATVAGLLNLRGAIVTVLDIRSRLGFPVAEPTEPGAVLLLNDGTETGGASDRPRGGRRPGRRRKFLSRRPTPCAARPAP